LPFAAIRCFTPSLEPAGESAMAQGQVRSNKEARKPKKDAKKKGEPAVQAPPVSAIKLKEKK
jgi:hypothetical protein